ncbi:para-aminobenzoate synthetase [Saccharopolyspora erythraea NRRL 2338]|uniref:aminodeoxychorismate synthase n=2 Tax=Saccharopolyspora erythraea TaxID=1836 RepID=A4FGY2_SACEN|nr:aminodeoxychorismate synthase component I [Saccharopolyspora erythraea]PFG97012.1 para-aminobenzoate synthetase [Saccharopolyspora erythraea NRRL 2338]QRK87222.1 aminodeoxychorismate synthase component I [Saccharopolyspora erythraea]CAM03307.1 putative para-aminobenzoic acid synthase [Saccharopolyspora erythraea NRRL 2338]
MRTLIIDNYDSYTYNLFQLIAEVNGQEPVVITNDATAAEEVDLAEYDNIVISPGPGRPDRSGDFGISGAITARAGIPVLGVCLGHQGIAAVHGAPVVPAPAPRHGHLTRVTHDDRDLFAGIPQRFVAVRYHSLCVPEELPAELEATAWAEDGVLMGIRHRHRPLWGVQFHPESIETQFGRRLMANFRRLTEERTAVLGPRPAATDAPAAHRPRRAAAAVTHYNLHVETIDAAVDTEAAYTRLFSASDRGFWLDSAHVEPGLSRFSFLGDDSGPFAEVATYRVGEDAVAVDAQGGATTRFAGTIFDYIEDQVARRVVTGPDLPFEFSGGYVGYFGYELKADCGSANRHRSATPDACWLFADRFVAVDHEAARTYVVALSADRPGSPAEAQRWINATTAALRELPSTTAAPRRPGRPAPAAVDVAAVEKRLVRDREQYIADVESCRRELHAGESYEICVTNAVRIPAEQTGYDFYRELRRRNPAPYAAYLRLDEVEVACSSPERFLRVDHHRVAETKPIKGTAPRGGTESEDAELRENLVSSPKTRAENLMIVDLLRNDLGRVCEVGSVHVPVLMAAESYATVHQLVSTIRGTLRRDLGVVDCVRACFPGGSMTGAPKLRTMEIIDSLETEARGVYSGAIGFIGCGGTADLNIAIRTAVLSAGEWHVGAGGAIVLDSDPVEEYEEMLLKACAPLRAHSALFAVAEPAAPGADKAEVAS